MLKKARKKTELAPFYGSTPKDNGVCSLLRTILHPSVAETRLVVFV